MKTVQNRTIEGETVEIDDTHFINCTFVNCLLEYSGGEVVFERTCMRDCKYVFFGRARRTIHFLQGTGLLAQTPTEWAEFPAAAPYLQ